MTDTISPMDMPLLVADRCDRCGSQAYVRATIGGVDGDSLQFCGHHAAENMDALMRLPAVHIYDERKRLDAVS